jgi:RsiW-degrading membrane proteinase PrsW (M82 family)
VFWLLIKPGKLHTGELVLGSLITAGTLIFMNTLTEWWEGAFHINPPQTSLFTWIIAVGLAEELTKALPVLIVAYLVLRYRQIKLSVTMWMFLGTISGLVFGVKESAEYTSDAITTISQDPGTAIPDILSFVQRVVLDGAQHAVWAGISAFFIGLGINHVRRRWELIGFGLALVAILHGINDWQATNGVWTWIGIQALSLLLFLGYALSANNIDQRISETLMFQEQPLPVPGGSHHGHGPEAL